MRSHGIMFHHFCDEDKHVKGQGAITQKELSDMLDYYQEKYTILPAREYYEKAKAGKLRDDDVCLTFDDGLLCQYDVAYKEMKKRGLTGFFFIYTSPQEGILEKIEVYRHFRFSKFSDIEDFYAAFFKSAIEKDNLLKCDIESKLSVFNPKEYAKEFSFYTDNDRRFRYLRDGVLGTEKYNFLMDEMISDYGYDIEKNAEVLWLSKDNIRELYSDGNIIGLHSHTHPTVLSKLDYMGQYEEYSRNKEILEGVINDNVKTVSYPCNSYNEDTFNIMSKLDINIGFRANMEKHDGQLVLPREDHANILKQMKSM